MRRRYYCFCVVLTALTTAWLFGCTWPYTVWIVPGSTATKLVFGLATDSSGGAALPLEYVVISEEACDLRSRLPNKRVWYLERDTSGEAPPVGRLNFGAPPVGYRSETASGALRPGCYHISVTASGGHHGGVTFRVDSSGIVASIPWRTIDSAYAVNLRASQRQDSIAATRCAVAYRAARSAGDTARADQKVWYDTTVFSPGLTCQFVCTKVGPHSDGEAVKRSRCASTSYNMYGQPL